MKLVKMDGDYDCGAACLAMVLGLKTSRAVYPMLGYTPDDPAGDAVGVTEEEIAAILTSCGIGYARYASVEFTAEANGVSLLSMMRRVKLPTEAELHCKLNQHRGLAIVSVTRLGEKGYMPGHFVIVRNGEVYDPARKNRYIGAAKSLPVCTALILRPPQLIQCPYFECTEIRAAEDDYVVEDLGYAH